MFFHLLYLPFPKQALGFSGLQYKPFENTWEKEKLQVTSNLSFSPQCFLPVWRIFSNFHQILNCRLQALSVWKSLRVVVWERVNPFSNKPWFVRVCCTSLLKTLWEKEKLLVTSNFSFFPKCFLPVSTMFYHFHQI